MKRALTKSIFQFYFSTNPNPKRPYIHAVLPHLLGEKSKVGFDKLDDALYVFDQMLLMKPLPTVINFNQLLTALVKMQHYSAAVSLFRDMRVLCVPVDIITYNTVINCLCHLNKLDYAFSLLGGIIKSGFVPDVVTYTTLITNPKTIAKRPCFPYFSKPTHARLQTLLREKLKAGFNNVDDAVVLFDKMIHMKPLPTVIDFTQLLAALVTMKQYSVVVSLFREMLVNSISVDIYTVSTVINCFCYLNRVDYAFSLLAGIIKRGLVPDVVTYTTLIRGLISQDKTAEAQLLFQNLIRFKVIQPNVITYNTIIISICKRGHPSMAVALFRYMEKNGCKPNTVTYSTIIDCLCKHRLVDHALDLLHEMTRKGIAADVITYSSMIQGLCAFNRWHDISQLLKEMDTKNINSFSPLIMNSQQSFASMHFQKRHCINPGAASHQGQLLG